MSVCRSSILFEQINSRQSFVDRRRIIFSLIFSRQEYQMRTYVQPVGSPKRPLIHLAHNFLRTFVIIYVWGADVPSSACFFRFLFDCRNGSSERIKGESEWVGVELRRKRAHVYRPNTYMNGFSHVVTSILLLRLFLDHRQCYPCPCPIILQLCQLAYVVLEVVNVDKMDKTM